MTSRVRRKTELLLKTWQVSTDATAPGRSVGELEVISPGAAGTEHALRFKGRVESATGFDRGYVAARYAFTLPAGARGLRGIQIEVRGDQPSFPGQDHSTRSDIACSHAHLYP